MTPSAILARAMASTARTRHAAALDKWGDLVDDICDIFLMEEIDVNSPETREMMAILR